MNRASPPCFFFPPSQGFFDNSPLPWCVGGRGSKRQDAFFRGFKYSLSPVQVFASRTETAPGFVEGRGGECAGGFCKQKALPFFKINGKNAPPPPPPPPFFPPRGGQIWKPPPKLSKRKREGGVPIPSAQKTGKKIEFLLAKCGRPPALEMTPSVPPPRGFGSVPQVFFPG